MHKIHVVYRGDESEVACEDLLSKAVIATLQNEGVDMPCVVSVLVTDDDGIRVYNRDHRNIDKATDVLSFPMQEFVHSGWSGLSSAQIDEDTGDLPLGDMIISTQSVQRQAEEYGNSIEYETAYLTIHSTLHLLGYEHGTEISESIMHEKNKSIINEMGFSIK